MGEDGNRAVVVIATPNEAVLVASPAPDTGVLVAAHVKAGETKHDGGGAVTCMRDATSQPSWAYVRKAHRDSYADSMIVYVSWGPLATQ